MHWTPLTARVLCLLMTAWHAGATTECRASDKPNVLFIVSDDLTTALGAYGRPVSTPNIDALAARGVRFDNAYSQYPVCGPSRASMMTGLYPAAIGAFSNGTSNFRDRFADVTTLPQLFRKNGYQTTRVSKIYHMGVPPDIINGTSGIDDPLSWDTAINVTAPEGNALGAREDLTPQLGAGAKFLTVESTQGDLSHADGMAAQHAVDWLRDRDQDAPFFLAVGMVRPHVPLVAPESYFDLYPYEDVDLPFVPVNDLGDIPSEALTQANSNKYQMSEEEQKKAIAGYYASVSYMDAQVGRVLDELDAQGLTDDTIIVFTSDHGYNLGEHTTWQKLSLFEDTLRVPLIISTPGQSTAAANTSGVVEAIDLYPTIAELAGLSAPAYLHGQSFANLLSSPGESLWQDESAYAITFNGGESLRTSQWRYNAWSDGSKELYDLINDPGELTNLATDSRFAADLVGLEQLLQEKRTESLSFDIYQGLGDLDENGVVDRFDWFQFRPRILTDMSGLTSDQAFALGDFDRSGRIDGFDFAIFKIAYEADNGHDSFALLSNPAPAPGASLLAFAGAWLYLLRRYRRAHSEAIRV